MSVASRDGFVREWVAECHAAMRVNTTMAASAASENHAMLRCPRGSTMNAANSGPSAVPAFPPTWKSDCASPCWPPDARRATRDDSG